MSFIYHESMNPYKVLRNELGLTQKDLARFCGVTPQVITSLESGLFNTPPVGITKALIQLELERRYSHVDIGSGSYDSDSDSDSSFTALSRDLIATYEQWVVEERGRHRGYFTDSFYEQSDPSDPNTHTGTKHTPIIWDMTWVKFRNSVNDRFRGFCRALVFQPSMLQEFEKYNRHSEAVVNALIECGVDPPVARRVTSLPKQHRIEGVKYGSDIYATKDIT